MEELEKIDNNIIDTEKDQKTTEDKVEKSFEEIVKEENEHLKISNY